MDNRLDYISNIEPKGSHLMTVVRKRYIELDDILRYYCNNSDKPLDPAGLRTIALARTHLETSLQFAIKTLCLQYEIKNV